MIKGHLITRVSSNRDPGPIGSEADTRHKIELKPKKDNSSKTYLINNMANKLNKVTHAYNATVHTSTISIPATHSLPPPRHYEGAAQALLILISWKYIVIKN